MTKQEKILRKLNREITNMYNDGTLETDQFNELTDLTNKALTFCEVGGSSDKIIIELSDNELKIVTKDELKEMQESAIEFDGFESWIVKGRLV